ncbi:hypothetical protein Q2941_44460 [Bradyrhizobium sp. UFLA05-153]
MALFAAGWWLPDPVAHTPSTIIPNERVNLRIRSDHKWPERVVFDTAHSVGPLAAESGPKPDAVPNQDLGFQVEQSNPLDAFAAMDGPQATPPATNEKATAIRAKSRPLTHPMTRAAKAE